METPLLRTKLYIPPPRPELVVRIRLIKQLNNGLHRKLTLISAPAGFGKSTLVSSWFYDLRFKIDENQAISQEKIVNQKSSIVNNVAWLSLDENDNNLTRFLTYFVAALQTLASDFGEGVQAMLQVPQPPASEAILTALLNEIMMISEPFILVLDDYHLIDTQSIDEAVTFLLDHLPQHMHLVIATREDPPFPLARYRVRGEMTEIRAVDLRFTVSEAAKFLNQSMGLTLSEADVTALEARTEGWIAGLQMAALALQRSPAIAAHTDSTNFVQDFTGSHRFVLDYLLEEVLQSQPETIRDFLLQTAILDRLSDSLCVAVVGQTKAKEMLDTLERGNLFIIPLDDKRKWYRYHHLFADVLQARLLEEQPDQVPILHLRASEWYEQNDLMDAAIRHALVAENFERAAGLIEMLGDAEDAIFQPPGWLSWVQALPEEIIQTRPVLSALYGWELLGHGELEAAEARLRDAERWLDPAQAEQLKTAGVEMVFVNEREFRLLPASLAAARTYQAQALGDIPATIKYGQRAIKLYPEEEHVRRGAPAALLGITYWASGDLDSAYQTLTEIMNGFRKAGNIIFALSGTYGLADIKLSQGQLREAVKVYEESLALAMAQPESLLQGKTDLYLGLGMLAHERGDVAATQEYMQKNEELGEQAALPDWACRSHQALAKIKQSAREFDEALDLLDEAERLYYRGPIPIVRPIEAQKVRIWLKQDRLSEALAWVRDQDLTIEDDLTFLREFEHITFARVLIAHYQADQTIGLLQQALSFLDRLLAVAEEGGRMASVIEILTLQALARASQGDIPTALAPFEQALKLAEPEGYVRIFTDEGAPMARLLAEATKRGIMSDYATRLLAVFGTQAQPDETITSPPTQPLIEPLSERELEVLQLIAQGLSNQEISEHLFLALSTVKGHNRRIFDKLQVQRRTEAVARARELGLV